MGVYVYDCNDGQLIEFINRCMAGGWEDMSIDTLMQAYSFKQRMEDYGPNIKFVANPSSKNERSTLQQNLVETVAAPTRKWAAENYYPGDELLLAYGQFLDKMRELDSKLLEIAKYSDAQGSVTIGEIAHEINADRDFWERWRGK